MELKVEGISRVTSHQLVRLILNGIESLIFWYYMRMKLVPVNPQWN